MYSSFWSLHLVCIYFITYNVMDTFTVKHNFYSPVSLPPQVYAVVKRTSLFYHFCYVSGFFFKTNPQLGIMSIFDILGVKTSCIWKPHSWYHFLSWEVETKKECQHSNLGYQKFKWSTLEMIINEMKYNIDFFRTICLVHLSFLSTFLFYIYFSVYKHCWWTGVKQWADGLIYSVSQNFYLVKW